MANYRLYCINAGGHIGQAEWIEAADDSAAIRQVRPLLLHALKCEVWQGSRLVATLDAEALAAR